MGLMTACMHPAAWDCPTLVANWKANSCTRTIRDARLMSSRGKRGMSYSRRNLTLYSKMWGDYLDYFFKKHSITDDVTSTHYCSMLETIMDICSTSYTAPLCSDYLDKMCKSHKRSRVGMSRVWSNLCGCRVDPDPTYLKYTRKPSCDPMCNRVGVSQRVDMDTGHEQRCDVDVCVINDVTVDMYDSSVRKGTLVNQICGHCGKDGCTCIISGVSVSKVLERTKLPVVFSQFCSGHSVCIQKDSSGNTSKVTNCKEALTRAKSDAEKSGIGTPVYLLVVAAAVVLFISVCLLILSKIGS